MPHAACLHLAHYAVAHSLSNTFDTVPWLMFNDTNCTADLTYWHENCRQFIYDKKMCKTDCTSIATLMGYSEIMIFVLVQGIHFYLLLHSNMRKGIDYSASEMKRFKKNVITQNTCDRSLDFI